MPEIKPTVAQQVTQATSTLLQQRSGHVPTSPVVPRAEARDAITKLTYERGLMKVLPESQTCPPDLLFVGSEQWIG